MPEIILEVKELRKIYKVGTERIRALDGVSFKVPRGQICCVVGSSGSGKSTLLNQLAGLEKPTSGCVIIAGYNISAFSENKLARFRQRYIGFIFQSYNLLGSMTALENVSLPLLFRAIGKRKRFHVAKKALDNVGLSTRMNHRPSQMSGGQQQRVGIARAFVANPKIIFADEPTGNLDSVTSAEVLNMMLKLCRENDQTLLMVTHDSEIAKFADRVITLMDGRIISDINNTALNDKSNNAGDETNLKEDEGNHE